MSEAEFQKKEMINKILKLMDRYEITVEDLTEGKE